ncbi:FAD-binding oxidoreductase [Pseudoruegeria sp. HB172150]|uniref:FAD-binding oxidoreductase n=1 Tax=Pseudoruegeria sp. HB172150 TaxID=2721164 RepID=UPI0015567A67|nr:FAD-binding oxidoreductase [Pseudoruegeria sp. HB172150]
MADPALVEALVACGHDLGLITGAADAARYATDATRRPDVVPEVVIRPKDKAGVSAALALCHRFGQPVAVQGGLTGLSGGARVRPGEVVLSTERLTGLGAPDADAMLIRAGAGVTLQRLQEAAAEQGLCFGVDLGARGTATVGGGIATNAGGIRVLRYGMFRAQVAGMEAVLADGTVVSSMRGLEKNNAGPDLRQLFTGSEGIYGVITEALLRLHPAPGLERNALCAVEGPEAALALLRMLRGRLGGLLSAFEGLWPEVYDGACGIAGTRPLPLGSGLYVLIEIQAPKGLIEEDAFEQVLMDAYEAGLCGDIVVAQSRREFDGIWHLREACPEFTFSLGRLVPHDLSLPLRAIPEFLGRAREAVEAVDPVARIYVYGHLADGNLHYVVKSEMRAEVSAAVNTLAARMGGSITAEHGVGTDKKPYLSLVRSAEELGLLRRLKSAMDPAGILNPGRVIGLDD